MKETKQKYKQVYDANGNCLFYKLINEKIVSNECRLKLINAILECRGDAGNSIIEEINEKWVKNAIKTSNSKLMDNEAVILDILSSYLIVENENQEYPTLSKNKHSNIKKRENYDIEDLDKLFLFHSKNLNDEHGKIAKKRWRQTSTYKLNKIKRNYYFGKWCYVNADNEFEYKNKKYLIQSNKYKNSKSKLIDFILVTESKKGIKFYDMNINLIPLKYIILRK